MVKKTKRKTVQSPRCSICRRKDVMAIDAKIAAGVPVRSIVATVHGVAKTTIERHAEHRKAKPAASAPTDGPLPSAREMAERLTRACLARLESVESNEAIPELDRVTIANRLSSALVRLGALTGEVGSLTERDLLRHPKLRAAGEIIMKALEPWPPAMVAVAEALRRAEAGEQEP